MQVRELARGLWYWTGLHPAWTPGDGGPDGWEQEVGCYFYEGPDAVCLFDPLIPMEDRDRFFEALDRDVKRAGQPVRILLTTESHRRSSAELAERYGATVGELPTGVQIGTEAWDEIVYSLPEHRALVCGDVILGRAHGLEVPRAWVRERYDQTIAELRPLLDLPIERVLVTHGEPVLEDGFEGLARALGG